MVSLLVASASCNEHNPASCDIKNNAGMNGCPDAATSGGSCKADDNCLDKANFPACDTTVSSGTCFKCTASSHALCTGETPHCDNHECVACVDDNDCDAGAGVCLPSGGCAAPSSIIYATPNGAGGTCGGATTPCTLDAALIIARTGPKVIKLDVPGTYTSATNFVVDVDAATPLTIDARNAIIHRNSDGTIFTINNGKGMTILGGTIENATGGGAEGIRCGDNATLAAYGTTIRMNEGPGINATMGCTLTLSRSRIESNQGGGLTITNGKFVIVGNMFLSNGGPSGQNAGVTISTMADNNNRFEFNTVANNATTTSSTTAGIDCKAGIGFTATHNIIWNNMIGGNASTAPQIVNTCIHAYSDIGPMPGTGTTNFNDPPLLTVDGHLGAGSPAIKKVETGADLSGLASRDIDGDRRIAPADLGADQLPRP